MSADYQFVTDAEAQDWNFIIPALRATYMGQGRSNDAIIRSFKGSLAFGVKSRSLGAQIGCCRVITDGVTYAWLADVVIGAQFRRRGAGRSMVQSVLDQPRFKGIVFHIHSLHAEPFYGKFGFLKCGTMARASVT